MSETWESRSPYTGPDHTLEAPPVSEPPPTPPAFPPHLPRLRWRQPLPQAPLAQLHLTQVAEPQEQGYRSLGIIEGLYIYRFMGSIY